MPSDHAPPPPEQNCEKCGQPAEFSSYIPRFGDRPAFRIFDCPTCKALTWIAEAITGHPDDA